MALACISVGFHVNLQTIVFGFINYEFLIAPAWSVVHVHENWLACCLSIFSYRDCCAIWASALLWVTPFVSSPNHRYLHVAKNFIRIFDRKALHASACLIVGVYNNLREPLSKSSTVMAYVAALSGIAIWRGVEVFVQNGWLDFFCFFRI